MHKINLKFHNKTKIIYLFGFLFFSFLIAVVISIGFIKYFSSSATATQFYLTDSVNHFFRGALYFNTEVTDSILPINNFLKEDVKHIIKTFRWKSQ